MAILPPPPPPPFRQFPPLAVICPAPTRVQLRGLDFDRQKPIDNYIVDFFCSQLMLAIEIDGDSHDDKVSYDEVRQRRLESLGVRFLRFDDLDIKTNMEGVLSEIENWVRHPV